MIFTLEFCIFEHGQRYLTTFKIIEQERNFLNTFKKEFLVADGLGKNIIHSAFWGCLIYKRENFVKELYCDKTIKIKEESSSIGTVCQNTIFCMKQIEFESGL